MKINFRTAVKTIEEVRKALQSLRVALNLYLPSYGTSFPDNAGDGQIFTRTDLSITYQYQNNSWVDISTGGGGGEPETNYLLWMDGSRAQHMDGSDFILMSA